MHYIVILGFLFYAHALNVNRFFKVTAFGKCHNRFQSLTLSAVPEMREADMTLDELKAELDMRGVNYDDCFSKGELVSRLVESRTLGRANPEILERFNQDIEELGSNSPVGSRELDAEIVEKAVAKDGGLPGGMSPELLKSLSADPAIMQMLRDPKMQDIMTSVMRGGPDAMKKYLSDPDAVSLLQRLSSIMDKALKK